MQPDVVHVLPDKLGGVHTVCRRLLESRPAGALAQRVVLTHNHWSRDPRPAESLPAPRVDRVENCLPAENLFAALRRLAPLLEGPGVLLAHDLLELAAVAAFPPERAVFQMLHGDLDYYYDLAVRHDDHVDVYITISDAMRRQLVARLPHRADSILLLRTGVRIGTRRTPSSGPLRLLYSGRIEAGQKGVFDLPVIASRLREAGVDVAWTIQGDGPDLEALRGAWPDANVRWTGARTTTEAIAELQHQDVCVMPSRWEGLPFSLLEAAAAGLVPVVSRISGLDEVVIDGETGFCCTPGDAGAFAAAISRLARDRSLIDRLGSTGRERIAGLWDIEKNGPAFHQEFGRWRERRRPRQAVGRVPYGSRLDQPWLPNPLVKAVRRFTWRPPQ